MTSIEYNEDLYNEFLYNEGTLVYPPENIEPEDARSIVADLFPTRVNWVANPGFQSQIDVSGEVGWKTTVFDQYDLDAAYNVSHKYDQFSETTLLTATRHTISDVPYVNYAAKINPGTALQYADLADVSYAIPVAPPEGDDKPFVQYQKNLWKFSFFCRQDVAEETSPPPDKPTDIYGGFIILRTDGTLDSVLTSTVAKPLPWERVAVETSTVAVDPVSSSGWFSVYEVLDLGPDALWAIPIITNFHKTDKTYVTGIIAERWDDITLLSGNLYVDVGQEQGYGEARVTPLQPWEYDWTRADLLTLDPLIYFDGDSSLSTQDDFVWISPSDMSHSVSGYYPQRRQRTDGLRSMMGAWLPVSRSASIRYVLDTPRALRRP